MNLPADSIWNPPPGLRRYAWLVAGPRDLVINGVINGVIAWFLYRGYAEVPLVTGHSVFSMLVPMTFILSFATTFFGYLSGLQWLKSASKIDGGERKIPWMAAGIRAGLLTSVCCGFIALAALMVCQRYFLEQKFSASATIAGLTAYAGALAYVLHALAVVRSWKFTDRGKF